MRKIKEENKRFEFYEIDELDVINDGLITRALYVNEGSTAGMEISDCSITIDERRRE